MNIAITGSNGFLGNRFIHFNKKKSKKIICFPSKVKNGNKFYKDEKNLINFLNSKNIDVLIHFAGIRKKECEESKENAKNSIFNFTRDLIKGIKKENENIHFIYISSDHVFDGNSKNYKENNLKNLKPKTSLGIFKLKSENYIKKNLKNWTIVRLSAVMDDKRLFNFVLETIKKKRKISLYTNIFFSPILSSDLFRIIYKIIKLKKFSKVIHCSGNKRINKFDFYSKLFGKSIFFLRAKAKISNFHPKDLSLSNKDSSLILNYKFTNFERSIKDVKKIFTIN